MTYALSPFAPIRIDAEVYLRPVQDDTPKVTLLPHKVTLLAGKATPLPRKVTHFAHKVTLSGPNRHFPLWTV
jgi:hypothetical protein